MISHSTPTPAILLVDDDPSVLKLLNDILSQNFDCVAVGSAEAALVELDARQFGLVVSDINLGGMSGVELIPHVHARSPDTVVMVISGNLTLDSPIDAMRKGAFDYLRKPFDIDHVVAAASRAIAHHELLVENHKHELELEKLVEERTARLQFLTYHDSLTSLPNRALFEDRLGQILLNSTGDTQNAVLLVSIDRLQSLRETLGPESASTILLDVAQRILRLVQPTSTSTLGRIDGDLFAILIPDTTPSYCVHLAGRLIEELGKSFKWKESELHLNSRIGISLHPNDGNDVGTLIKNAAAALAHARESTTAPFVFYSDGINALAADRMALETDLWRSIEQNELAVYYQPKIDLETGAISGMEALARWKHPVRGMVRPDIFITLAEEIGMIDKIGEWILRAACQQNMIWQEMGFDLELAVNLSGLQLQKNDCSARLLQILAEIGYDPQRLNMEVTETAIMEDLTLSIGQLKHLRDQGVKISIDDFGTGYSSLNAFKRLPIDVLKIDREFVNDLAANPIDTAFVRTIVDLAHLFEAKVVAEGVETEDQLSVLKGLGCDQWQGYLYSTPVSAEDFSDLLAKDSRITA